LSGLLALTPIVAFVFFVPLRCMASIERWLLAYALAWLSLAAVMPVWRVGNFGFVPRYMLVIVPIVALAAGRAVEAWRGGSVPLTAATLGLAALAVLWWGSGYAEIAVVLPVLVAAAAALGLALMRRYEPAAAVLVAIVLVGPLLRVPTQIPRYELAPYLDDVADWLREHPAERSGAVYTNVPLLAPFLDGTGNVPDVDVRFLLGVDLAYDIENMTSTHSNQRSKLPEVLAAGNFNGARGILPQDLSIDTIPEGALFVFRRDGRLALLMPPQTWDPYLVPLVDGDFKIMRFQRRP
jgi:hypothetical protein